MRLPRRPFPIVAALLAIVALALAIGGCGGDSDDDPRSLLKRAAAKRIDSAEVRLRTDANVPGFPILGERLVLTARGPIAVNGPDALPTLDWSVMLRAGGQSFPARLMAIDNKAYVDFQGLSYEADRELLEQFGLRPQGATRSEPMSLRQFGIDPSAWLTNAKLADGEEIGGDSTQVVTGRVKTRAVLDDLVEVAGSADVRERLKRSKDAPELSEKNVDLVAQAIERIDVEVNVDEDDQPRRVYAKLAFEMPKEVKNTAIERGTIAFELVLDEIGDVEVAPVPPVDPRPLSQLLDLAGLIFGVEEPSDLWEQPSF
jgi:hypothetical protein